MNSFWDNFLFSSYQTYTAQQHPEAWEIFKEFLYEEQFDLIIEIGTAMGGLTEFIYDLNYNIISFDIDDKYNTHSRLVDKGININHIDIFKYDLKSLIKQNNKVLLLCDGGNKAKEFNTFSKLLKTGDVIMAHDYCVDSITFYTKFYKKIWLYLELLEKDIAFNSFYNNLIHYKQNIFSNIVWVCKIKTEQNIIKNLI